MWKYWKNGVIRLVLTHLGYERRTITGSKRVFGFARDSDFPMKILCSGIKVSMGITCMELAFNGEYQPRLFDYNCLWRIDRLRE